MANVWQTIEEFVGDYWQMTLSNFVYIKIPYLFTSFFFIYPDFFLNGSEKEKLKSQQCYPRCVLKPVSSSLYILILPVFSLCECVYWLWCLCIILLFEQCLFFLISDSYSIMVIPTCHDLKKGHPTLFVPQFRSQWMVIGHYTLSNPHWRVVNRC